ncbi:MAG: hypothetical protein JW885_11810 [Deltaproteobacteria bacterium]|nr:hypothetical protein [Candidatus Zymogenaceae bacterium]
MRRKAWTVRAISASAVKFGAPVLIACVLIGVSLSAGAQEMYLVGDAAYTGKIDAVIAGKGFYDLTMEECQTILIENCVIDTLTLTRCTAVSIRNCTIKNLVLTGSVSVEGGYITFNGTGVAITITDCVGVRITQSDFSGDYDDRLEETSSAAIEVDTKSRPATRRRNK